MDLKAIPTTVINKRRLMEGIPAFILFRETLCKSGMEARRLIEQGGAYINGRRVGHFNDLIRMDREGNITIEKPKRLEGWKNI